MTDKKTTFYKCILVNVYGDLWLHLLSAAEILPPSNSFICFFWVQIQGARIGLFWLNAGFYLCTSLLYLCHAVFPLPFKTQPPCCTFDGWPTRLHAGPSSKKPRTPCCYVLVSTKHEYQPDSDWWVSVDVPNAQEHLKPIRDTQRAKARQQSQDSVKRW